MPIDSNRVLAGVRYPAGPLESAPLQIARGTLALGPAGGASIAVPGFPANSTLIVTGDATVAPSGVLTADYDLTVAGAVFIGSSAGAADNLAQVHWLLIYC